MKTALTALALLTAFGAVPTLAANARHPYANVNRRNDSGNDTGDSRVDQLNQQQLDQARANSGGQGPATMGQPGMDQSSMARPSMAQPMMGQPGMGQPMMGQPGMAQPMMGQPGMAR